MRGPLLSNDDLRTRTTHTAHDARAMGLDGRRQGGLIMPERATPPPGAPGARQGSRQAGDWRGADALQMDRRGSWNAHGNAHDAQIVQADQGMCVGY